MGARGPKAKLDRPKKTTDYTRVDFDTAMSEAEANALSKLQAMKPRERTEWLTALWAEDQQRAFAAVAG